MTRQADDVTRFSERLRETVMVLATLRAVAAAGLPGTRLLGPVRSDDIIRAVDARMPLEEDWPGRVGDHYPLSLYARRDWRDGVPPDEVLMGVLDCAMRWQDDAVIVGPLRAGELRDALLHVLTGNHPEPETASPEAGS